MGQVSDSSRRIWAAGSAAGRVASISTRVSLYHPTRVAIIVEIFALISPYDDLVFDPDASIPRPQRSLIYFGACIIAGLRLARQSQVHPRVVPTIAAIDESCDLAHEIFNRV